MRQVAYFTPLLKLRYCSQLFINSITVTIYNQEFVYFFSGTTVNTQKRYRELNDPYDSNLWREKSSLQHNTKSCHRHITISPLLIGPQIWFTYQNVRLQLNNPTITYQSHFRQCLNKHPPQPNKYLGIKLYTHLQFFIYI